uniref:Putative secreted protein n=1 Tax=Anopheles marajoara TaxID=58244 RepID=A0A2M4C6R1_9DIPT
MHRRWHHGAPLLLICCSGITLHHQTIGWLLPALHRDLQAVSQQTATARRHLTLGRVDIVRLLAVLPALRGLFKERAQQMHLPGTVHHEDPVARQWVAVTVSPLDRHHSIALLLLLGTVIAVPGRQFTFPAVELQ